MKKSIVLLFILVSPLHAQTELTVEDAIKMGLRNNYDIQIARNMADMADNDTGKGNAGFLPTLEASNNYQIISANQETNSPFSFGNSDTRDLGAQISLNWTLFDGFKMFADRRKFNEIGKLGEVQARETIENTVVNILAAYFNLAQQEQLLDVSRAARDISETRLNKEQVRHELGGASSTDLLNAMVSFNNDQADFLNQELQILIARKELNILLGRDPATPIAVNNEIAIPPLDFDFDELLALAEERNSNVRVAIQNKIVAEQNVKLARAAFYPSVSVNASYDYTNRTLSSANPNFPEDIETQSNDNLIGLTLSYNLFNGARDRIELQNAHIESDNQELALRNARNQLAGLVQEKYVTFQKRIELVRLGEENVIAAQQNLQLQQDRYQIGAASSLEFRDAQVNLIRAQTLSIVDRYQARITRLEIEQLIGNLGIE